MTVLYVDTEHDLVLNDPNRAPVHHAVVERARKRIETASGTRCVISRFAGVTPAECERIGASALVIGGCATDWAEYDVAEFAGLLEAIHAVRVPILGICAGHQLIGLAHGAPWGPLGPLEEGEVDPDPRFGPGLRKQRGFLPVQLEAGCPLFRGFTMTGTFFQAHYWQLLNVPGGFVVRAHSPWSSIQAIERLDRPVFGVQFHPERFDAGHRDGEVVLRNFFSLAGTRQI